ncbi:hypothetical protein O5559_27790, partial [Escherichia coli]|nr:hypothetical protein [Escherichia coli]
RIIAKIAPGCWIFPATIFLPAHSGAGGKSGDGDWHNHFGDESSDSPSNALRSSQTHEAGFKYMNNFNTGQVVFRPIAGNVPSITLL